MKDLVNGVKAFRDVNLHHGDVQPTNIIVLNNKVIKLYDIAFMNDGMNGAQRKYHQHDYYTPLSP